MTVISQPDPSLQVASPPADADAAKAKIAPGIAHERSHRAGGWGWLLLLLAPVLCYGLPLLTAAVAGLGAPTLGLAAGIPLALVAVLTVGLGLRRRKIAAAHCCPVEAAGRRR